MSYDDKVVCVLGQGAFLNKAVKVVREAGFEPLVHITDTSSGYTPKGVNVSSWGDPNASFGGRLGLDSKSPVILANNPIILNDEFLLKHENVFNLHNSNVAVNRGLAQNCILDSMLRNHDTSATTLQQLEAGKEVDSSLTLHVEAFDLPREATFEQIMLKLSRNWLKVLTHHLIPHLDGDIQLGARHQGLGSLITLNNLETLVYDQGYFSQPLLDFGLGNFAGQFPRAASLVSEIRAFWLRQRI